MKKINEEKLTDNEKRKLRYQTDPVYRQLRIERSREYRRKYCEQVRARDKVRNSKEYRKKQRRASWWKHRDRNLKNDKRRYQQTLEASRAWQRDYYRRNKKENQARGAEYRAKKKKASPKWTNKEELKNLYINCPANYHVDHIIPLTHKDVCGLHVPWNLQYLSSSDNISKGNSFDFTYDNMSWKNKNG